jgi:hypothetical protein
MNRLVAAVAAFAVVGVGSVHAHHYNYVKVPVYPASVVGVPATGFSTFSYGVPAFGFGTSAFGFGTSAFGFGAPAFGFSTATPTLSLSLNPSLGLLGGGMSAADAQGLLDNYLLPLLLRQLMGGGGVGGGRVNITDDQIKKLADAIFTQSELKGVPTRLANVEKLLKAYIKATKPELLPKDETSRLSPSPESQRLRAEFQSRLQAIKAKQATWQAGTTAAKAPKDERARFLEMLARIKARQAEWEKTNAVTADGKLVSK